MQRFGALEDLETSDCTIEEREEYELHVVADSVVYAGVDYADVLKRAEHEADIIVWDGGNNDLPFYEPSLHLVVTDALRVGNELAYYPGEANLRMADVVLINKVDAADVDAINTLRENIRDMNPRATVVEAASPITVDHADRITDKRVLVVEDGPTLTHGEMRFRTGTVAAYKYGAGEVVDPRPHAVGSISETFRRYPHRGRSSPPWDMATRRYPNCKRRSTGSLATRWSSAHRRIWLP